METIPVLDAFHYILSRMFKIKYYQSVVVYNRLKALKNTKVYDEKIIEIANLLRQKENVVNE